MQPIYVINHLDQCGLKNIYHRLYVIIQHHVTCFVSQIVPALAISVLLVDSNV